MKRSIFLIIVLMFSFSGISHAVMTDKEIARSLKVIYECRRELNDLAIQRQAEEEDLVVEYKVNECNQKRKALIEKYQVRAQEIAQRMAATEASLGTK